MRNPRPASVLHRRTAPRTRTAAQRGLTLIELMVALVIGLIFSLSVLLVQSALTRQNMQLSDVGQRDTQARAALDLLTRDLTNAGFMLDGVQTPCAATLAYNSGLPSNQNFFQYPVAAFDQPTTLPTSSSLSGSVDANTYPPNGSTNVSQMVVITGSTSALLAPGNGNPTTFVVQNSTTQAAGGQGALKSSVLPLSSTTGLTPGDTALLRMPLGGKLVCFRVPIAQIGPGGSPSSTYVASKSTQLFPANAYADSGFQTQLVDAGLLAPGAQLTNANLIQSRLTDLGPASTSSQEAVAYYVASFSNTASGGTLPMLMRATIDAADDTLVGTPNPVAAGVVSLQALFGVDETSSGGVTNYLSWPDVVSGRYTGDVRSVLFAIVTRTLHSDPKKVPVTGVAVPSPKDNGGPGPDAFTAYTPTASEQQDRFSVIESEVAIRNQLWPH
jgi:type IV pilus assembly protein PilW